MKPSPAARLLLLDKLISLYPGQRVTLGRSSENDIVLDDPKVSRTHAVLEWTASGFTIRDNGSANGTFVNTARLSDAPHLLSDGDVITLSRLEACFKIERAESSAIPAASTPAMADMPTGLPYLTVVSGPDLGQRYPLWGEVITIGRASREATWEIRLTDRSVSRPHARLERGPDGYTLTDLESANGTTLNDIPIQKPVLLNPDDRIGVGESVFLFSFE